uniref:Uncharacterized protein n=1 Tax=Timema shepardi TaxID=629360 RepID=A0A7R9AMY5_TIMSH|nr:unnamed protein product [Timema shepardi]
MECFDRKNTVDVISELGLDTSNSQMFELKRSIPGTIHRLAKQLKEYELSEVFQRSEDERHYDVINMDDLGPRRANLDNNEIQTQIEGLILYLSPTTFPLFIATLPPSITLHRGLAQEGSISILFFNTSILGQHIVISIGGHAVLYARF